MIYSAFDFQNETSLYKLNIRYLAILGRYSYLNKKCTFGNLHKTTNLISSSYGFKRNIYFVPWLTMT